MKKTKLLMPLLGVSAISGMVLPAVSCSTNNAKITLTLYTDAGTFSNGQRFITLPLDSATKLGEIQGYEEPTLPTYIFTNWTDVKGDVVDTTRMIDKDTALIANFEEPSEDTPPADFSTDGWGTLCKVCDEVGFIPFAKAYCGYSGSVESEAKKAINQWILSDQNIRYMGLNYTDIPVLAKVRLIGIEQDEGSVGGTAKFTFEFADVIDIGSFDTYVPPENGEQSGYFNRWDDTEDNVREESLLYMYLNDLEGSPLIQALPDSLSPTLTAKLVPVAKKTVVTNQWGTKLSDATGISDTDCFFFPLSRAELNDYNGTATHESGDPSQIDADEFEDAENEAYTFYNRGEPTGEYEQMECRIKCYAGTNEPANYWTRSPYLGDYDARSSLMSRETWENMYEGMYTVAGVVYDGGVFTTFPSFTGLGIAPAFCIGVEA